MSITPVILMVLASSGVCMGLTMLAHAKLPERRLHKGGPDKRRQGLAFVARLAGTAVFSMTLVVASTYLLAGRLFREGPTSIGRGVFEVVAILGVYDVLYYLLHRYLFHGVTWLKRVHAVHHRARRPIAIDSLFLHPVENFLGLALLLACTWMVGPVSVVSFGACFFVYSWLNIIVHAGVDLPIPYCGMLARKHAIHHDDMRAGNYASLSPIPDMLFGTAE